MGVITKSCREAAVKMECRYSKSDKKKDQGILHLAANLALLEATER
jgi:hypothetical protein